MRIRWLVAMSAVMAAVVFGPAQGAATGSVEGVTSAATKAVADAPATLQQVAATDPTKTVTAIVLLDSGGALPQAEELTKAANGKLVAELPLINGFAADMPAAAALALRQSPLVRSVTLNVAVGQTNHELKADETRTRWLKAIGGGKRWDKGDTGKGVGVAVVDTGIAGDLADFKDASGHSRVIASAVVHPYARTAKDTVGHGTHVAGLVAGNSSRRPVGDPNRNAYAGLAPDANLISVKVDDDGSASVLDVINGLEFVVENRLKYNIRVVNLSLSSTTAESHLTDPLDAAVEATWFSGIAVVAAAGNLGNAPDAVHYAPGNDPWVISVGALDWGVKEDDRADDFVASFSSRGRTQDGYYKPELMVPGGRIVSNLAPGSEFSKACPSCIVDGEYIRVGGTSMSAPIVAGMLAQVFQRWPETTPDQAKARLFQTVRLGRQGFWLEPEIEKAVDLKPSAIWVKANRNLPVNENAGDFGKAESSPTDADWDASRWSASRWSASRWSASRWSSAEGSHKASYAPEESYRCNCVVVDESSVDPTASRWSASRWSASRWSSYFVR